ncbi:recombination protein RecR [bacterium]|nr:MAG: recombination protein RecR [bacterium]
MHPIKELIDQFQKLPSVGPKTARRFVYFLINKNGGRYLNDFENALREVKEKIGICKRCFNIAEGDLCSICNNQERDHQTICIVEEALDILPIEESLGFNGVYHVLGGAINPTTTDENALQGLHINELIDRIKSETLKEIILAFNHSAEGETTALYIMKLLSPLKIKISRLGRGLPTGGDIEYADPETLKGAFRGRQNV